MQTIYIIILSLLTLAICYTLVRAIRITQADTAYKFHIENSATAYESLGFTGYSVICYAINNIEQIENLLQSEYNRYEILAVIDSRLYPDIFYSIVKNYGLIRVNTIISNELPNTYIRALYRSRQRQFRRLVLIDEAYTSPYNSLNCATLVASYEYIIPFNATMRLRERAIEYAAILISESNQQFAAIHSSADEECYIIWREHIIQNKGFSAALLRNTPSKQILSTPTPLTYTIDSKRAVLRKAWSISSAIILPIIIIELIWTDGLLILATLLSALLIFLIVKYYTAVTDCGICPERAMLCYFRRIRRIFYGRKFLV